MFRLWSILEFLVSQNIGPSTSVYPSIRPALSSQTSVSDFVVYNKNLKPKVLTNDSHITKHLFEEIDCIITSSVKKPEHELMDNDSKLMQLEEENKKLKKIIKELKLLISSNTGPLSFS